MAEQATARKSASTRFICILTQLLAEDEYVIGSLEQSKVVSDPVLLYRSVLSRFGLDDLPCRKQISQKASGSETDRQDFYISCLA